MTSTESVPLEPESLIEQFCKNKEYPSLQSFIDSNIGFVASHTTIYDQMEEKWVGHFKKVTKKLKIKPVQSKKQPNWGAVARKVIELWQDAKSSVTPATECSDKSSSPQLYISFTLDDKARMLKNFSYFNEAKFWKLVRANGAVLNVDKKVIEFAKKCNYFHPAQSLVLDLADNNWENEFSLEELDDLDLFGDPIFPQLPSEIAEILSKVKTLKTPVDVYNFAQGIVHDPIKEPLKAWLSLELQKSAHLHFYGFELEKMLESDQLYELWSFIISVVAGSNIAAVGKEALSKADADAINKKRSIAALNPTCHRRMEHKMDIVYRTSRKEVGCVEIGKDGDQTKEMKDGLPKMPIVMHDMLAQLAGTKEMLRHAHVIGFVISGSKICLLDMDSPDGYIARIRRSEPLEYPSSCDDYVARIVPLLELALSGFITMEKTRTALSGDQPPLQRLRTARDWILPPTFIPILSLPLSSKSSSLSSCSCSSSTSKRQKV